MPFPRFLQQTRRKIPSRSSECRFHFVSVKRKAGERLCSHYAPFPRLPQKCAQMRFGPPIVLSFISPKPVFWLWMLKINQWQGLREKEARPVLRSILARMFESGNNLFTVHWTDGTPTQKAHSDVSAGLLGQ